MAQQFLQAEVQAAIDRHVAGDKPAVRFADAAAKYLEEEAGQLRAKDRAVMALDSVMPFIGHLPVEEVCNDSLADWKRQRLEVDGVSAGTVLRDLAAIRRVLSLCARKWRQNGKPLLSQAPPLLEGPKGPARKAHILTRAEEALLLAECEPHMQDAIIFALATGLRAAEQANLQWEDERYIPELNQTVFVIREGKTQNAERIVPLNEQAKAVVERKRGNGSEYVFAYEGRKVVRFNTNSFRKARKRAGLPNLTWHSLRSTYASRLRAAQVGIADIATLLGHAGPAGQRVTLGYAAADIGTLIGHVERLADERIDVVLRNVTNTGHLAEKQAVLH